MSRLAKFLETYEQHDRDLSVSEVAIILGISTEAIRRYIRLGILPAYKIGPAYRVTVHDLMKFLIDRKTV